MAHLLGAESLHLEYPTNETELQSLAVSRLGKDVVDLLDASVSYGDKQVLRGIEWRLAPGERTGILGANGAGKSTLLGPGDLEDAAGELRRPTCGARARRHGYRGGYRRGRMLLSTRVGG